jgi:glucosamine kinase
MAAARSVCGTEKGVASILGTGSNSCYYNGKSILKNSPGLGYVLGDEGSGAYLGKKVIQYYLYNTFDDDLRSRFDARFVTNSLRSWITFIKSLCLTATWLPLLFSSPRTGGIT